MSLEKLVDSYLRHLTIERGMAKNTVMAYRRDLALYLSFLEQREIKDIKEVLVKEDDFPENIVLKEEVDEFADW